VTPSPARGSSSTTAAALPPAAAPAYQAVHTGIQLQNNGVMSSRVLEPRVLS
jgi:hypothetical protein